MLVTASITPFREDHLLDLGRLQELVAFQLEQGAGQVLLLGTTGEGSSLSEDERDAVVEAALEVAPPERLMVALGAGGREILVDRMRRAERAGVRDLLLADCPYSGPSSAALRTHFYGPIAESCRESRLFPYVVPSRTGTELLPDDLARLAEDHPQVVGVKDATGRLARMMRVRQLCGDDFLLLCGEDGMLADALLDPVIRADGGVLFAANLAPAACEALIEAGRAGEAATAHRLADELAPLMSLVSVRADEWQEWRGERNVVPQRYRNPLPIKTAMQELGLLAAGCRAPLGEMGVEGARSVSVRLAEVSRRAPHLLAPLLRASGRDVSAVDSRPTGGEARESRGAAHAGFARAAT